MGTKQFRSTKMSHYVSRRINSIRSDISSRRHANTATSWEDRSSNSISSDPIIHSLHKITTSDKDIRWVYPLTLCQARFIALPFRELSKGESMTPNMLRLTVSPRSVHSTRRLWVMPRPARASSIPRHNFRKAFPRAGRFTTARVHSRDRPTPLARLHPGLMASTRPLLVPFIGLRWKLLATLPTTRILTEHHQVQRGRSALQIVSVPFIGTLCKWQLEIPPVSTFREMMVG